MRKHLNWQWLIGLVASGIIRYIIVVVMGRTVLLSYLVGDIIFFVIMLAVSVRVISKKKRSPWWVMLAWTFAPLWLSNKGGIND